MWILCLILTLETVNFTVEQNLLQNYIPAQTFSNDLRSGCFYGLEDSKPVLQAAKKPV